jgi:hypothetical protein
LVTGADVKAKLWTSENAYLLAQGEFLHQERDDAGWDGAAAAYTIDQQNSSGGYVFADYNWKQRYNAGASFESFEDPAVNGAREQSYGAFAGLALMEETTAFRFDWRHVQPGRPAGASADPAAQNTVTLRVIFSMGPHKAHQF